MGNDHKAIQDLLSDYLSEDLNQDCHEAVRAHLEECEECRDFVRRSDGILAALRASADWDRTQHPSEEMMVLFAENPGRVERDVRNRIETHLLICEQCSHEMTLLESMSAIADSGSAIHQAKTGAEGLWPIFRRIMQKRTLVYALTAAVLILSYPVFRYLREPAEQVNLADKGMIAGEIVRLTERTRTTSSLPIVHPNSRDGVVRLSLSFWPQADREYGILLQGPGREPLRRQSLTNQEVQQGEIYLELSSTLLHEGEYQVILEGVDTNDRSDTLDTEFPFRVESAR